MGETEVLASYVVSSKLENIPIDVRHEAKRSIVNYVGCALGGSIEPLMDIALRALQPYSGKPTARVIGRTERLDPLHTSLMNGISSHVHDYDDTLPTKNYMHPSSPVASALFSYACVNPVRGADFMHAFILGFEVESRIGDAVYPAHYDAGWHITGTAGIFGAAVAIGKLMGLSLQQMIWAIGLAATQAAGIREMFGSMAKSFHAGRAAQNGYASALLAREGFTAGIHSIEGPRGFAAVTAAKYDLSKISNNLGVDFDLRFNTYKPFPCGIVVHPTIDGSIHLRNEHQLTPESIAKVRLHVAPLVLDLCNQRNITKGLQGKFCVYHSAAVGLVRGKAGLQEYTDEAVNDPQVKRVRELVTAEADPSITEDQARIEVELNDGRKYERFVEKSLGNIHRPMSDRQLDDKFKDQAALVLSARRASALLRQCWQVEELADVSVLVKGSIPAKTRGAIHAKVQAR